MIPKMLFLPLTAFPYSLASLGREELGCSQSLMKGLVQNLYLSKAPATHPSRLNWVCMDLAASEPRKYLLPASGDEIPDGRPGIHEIVFMGDGDDGTQICLEQN